MRITKQELIDSGASQEQIVLFVQNTNNTDEPVLISSLLDGDIYSMYLVIWIASKVLDTSKMVRFHCDLTLMYIHLLKPHTEKYNDIVDFLKNPTMEKVDCIETTDKLEWIMEEVEDVCDATGSCEYQLYAFWVANMIMYSCRSLYVEDTYENAIWLLRAAYNAYDRCLGLRSFETGGHPNEPNEQIKGLLKELFTQ